MGIDPALFEIHVAEGGGSDRDPQVLILNYKSVIEPSGNYLADRVKIEIGCRSLLEPAHTMPIHSIIGETLPDLPFSGKPFNILTVDPQRTMLEKMFLLHEEFSKIPDKVRNDRMSRHLYDLNRLMDTEYGFKAVTDIEMYKFIVNHRKKYTSINGLDYDNHLPQTINFIPPMNVSAAWERDYNQMQEMMIYGPAPTYPALIKRMEELKARLSQLVIKI